MEEVIVVKGKLSTIFKGFPGEYFKKEPEKLVGKPIRMDGNVFGIVTDVNVEKDVWFGEIWSKAAVKMLTEMGFASVEIEK